MSMRSLPLFLGGLLDFLLPRACALCGEPLAGWPQGESICGGCLARLGPPGPILPAPTPLAAAGAAGLFEGPLRDAIHLFKYQRRGELAGSLGRHLAAALPLALPSLTGASIPGLPGASIPGLAGASIPGLTGASPGPARPVDLVVPVPLHPARLADRGFNQAALLARPLARALGARLEARALVRVRDTPPQTPLDVPARRANVRGAFAVRSPARVRDRVCLLVDDVLTTGATAAACAKALRGAGADSVLLLVLARA